MNSPLIPPYLLHEQILIYACWSIGMLFLSKTKFINRLDVVIIWFVRIVGIVYFMEFPIMILADLFSNEYEQYVWINRYTGPYWFTAVMPLLVYALATQSLWWDYFRKAKYWRLILSVIILILAAADHIMVWLISFQRDEVASSWAMRYQTTFLHISSIIVFCCITGVGSFIVRARKNKLETLLKKE